MKKILSVVIQILLFPIPWTIRRAILNLLMNFKISKTARIGFSVILAEKLVMKEGALITHFTFVNNIDLLLLKSNSKIGKSNWVTGANTRSKMFEDSDRSCELILSEHARITDRHHIDCTGGVYIGGFTTLAGINSQILTHSIDIRLSKQVAGSVNIGSYCFIGTSSIILMGANLPDCCVLGAGAILNKKFEKTHSLYAGNPARPLKTFEKNQYSYFQRKQGHVG